VNEIKSLGVTVQNNFSFSSHINETISKCASSLYAIRILKAKGLNNELINRVFIATVLAKLTYASQLWWGFLNVSEKNRLEAFLKKAVKCNYYCTPKTFAEIAESADDALFNAIAENPNHALYPLLPPLKDTCSQKLRPRRHKFNLPNKSTSLKCKNFIYRMLYKDIY